MASYTKADQLVELDSNLKKALYPGLVLLDCLRETQPLQRNRHVDPMFQSSLDLEDQFHEFVCKVALLCQTKPSGDSVSACVVLQLVEGSVKYVFASNDRGTQELEEVKVKIRSLLHMLKRSPEPDAESEQPEELRRSFLRKALHLQVWRIRSYLRALNENLTICIQACANDTAKDAPILREYLEGLRGCTVQALKENDDLPINSIASIEDIIARLAEFGKLRIEGMFRRRLVREETLGSTANWYEIGHVAARLLAYERAVDIFLKARETWPELFESPEVDFIASSVPMAHPLSPQPLTTELIVAKVASANVRPSLTKAIESLKQFKLDENIAKRWLQHFNPVVHAEVLLHDWLENTEGGTHSERFFRRYKFIGTSKPPCRLCSFYFDELGTDVKVQPSHRNLYLSWRTPDVRTSQGPGAPVRRRKIILGMKERICADIIQTMGNKIADGRLHDSSSNSTHALAGTGDNDHLIVPGSTTPGTNSPSLSDAPHRSAILTPIPEHGISSSSDNWSTVGMEEEEQSDSAYDWSLKLQELSEEEEQSDNSDDTTLKLQELSEEEDVVLFKGRCKR